MENSKDFKTPNNDFLPDLTPHFQTSSAATYDKRFQRLVNGCHDFSQTPFRCSLSHRLAITRTKPTFEKTLAKRRNIPSRDDFKEHTPLTREPAELNSVFLKLPKIAQGARPILTGSSSSIRKQYHDIYDLLNPRNERENWELKRRNIKKERNDFLESQRSYEDVMKLREKHLTSSNLLKSSHVRTTTLPQLVRKSDLTYFEYKSADEQTSTEEETSEDGELESVEDLEDFCQTFKDGSKLVGSNRKLSIEVFMPKI